jgi:hypothetical protein
VYVLDTSSIRVFSSYYPQAFPAFWAKLDVLVSAGKLMSVREVLRELEVQSTKPHIDTWVETHRSLFLDPTEDELLVVQKIFAVPHFQQLVGPKQLTVGSPVADPFVIAAAHVRKACVVTEEALKPNGARIPNVCQHFGIQCTDVEGLMKAEGWKF